MMLSAGAFVKFYFDFLVIVRLNTIFATSKINSKYSSN